MMWTLIAGGAAALGALLFAASRAKGGGVSDAEVLAIAEHALEHETDWQVLWALSEAMDIRSTSQKLAGADPKTTLPRGFWSMIFALHNRAIKLSGSTNYWT